MRSLPGFGAIVTAVFWCAVAAGCGASGSGSRSVGEVAPSLGPPTALPVVGGVFLPGEQMRFELSLRGIVGGEAAVAVGQAGVVEGKRVIIVSSRVESAGVVALFREARDEVTTWIHMDTGLPLSHHAHVLFGDKESFVETDFAHGKSGGFDVEVRSKRPSGELIRRVTHQAMPEDQAAFDPHAVIGALRGWKAEEGKHSYFFVLVGRYLWQNTVRQTGHERVRTRMGQFDALRIDGVARRLTRTLREDRRKQPRYYTMWISNDETRMPLLVVGKTEYGEVRAELVDYTGPSMLQASR
ncbi:MAG TPA: DUF3108 domain-containing protein [Kofleriaceae bacterium]|nr:DUF3108 domain-containing protein [Kofleriaceae bacterium]